MATYRWRPSGARHQAKQGLVQLSNELSARALCDPLVPAATADDADYARAFLRRLDNAATTIAARSPDALLTIVIDAADNAAMMAADAGDRPFVTGLLREELPPNVRLVVTCRTERRDRLELPPHHLDVRLEGFDLAETRAPWIKPSRVCPGRRRRVPRSHQPQPASPSHRPRGDEHHPRGLDSRDLLASGMHYPPQRPSTALPALAELSPDADMRIWRNEDGHVVFISSVWDESDGGTSSRGSAGHQLLVDRSSLSALLRRLDRWLIVEVQIQAVRRLQRAPRHNTGRNDDQRLPYLEPYTKYFFVDLEGDIHDQ